MANCAAKVRWVPIVALFKKCYDDAVKQVKIPGGKVILDWEINDVGAVTKAKIKSTTLNNSVVEDCMISNLKTLKFPEAPKGTVAVVQYPIVFASQKVN